MSPTRRQQRMAHVAHHRSPFVALALEHVHHRHNVSAVLRTADALGIHRVFLVGTTEFRVSRGAARGADRWLAISHHADVAEALQAVRAEGYRLYAADLADPPTAPESLPIDQPLCLWFGAEVLGVSQAVLSEADGVVTLPMLGMPQSLNVSVAAALVVDRVLQRVRATHGADALLSAEGQQALLGAWIARDEDPDAPGTTPPVR